MLIKADQVNVQNKVVLPQRVVEVLEDLKKTWSNVEIITDHANPEEYWSGTRSPLNEVGLDDLIKALYIGYTIEQTIEEQLLERYKKHNEPKHSGRTELSDVYDKGVANGIYETLDIIGMKVKGINA